MKRRIVISAAVAMAICAGIAAAVLVFGHSSPPLPADRTVDFVQPPGRYSASGGRVVACDREKAPGGFCDYNDRVLNFYGLVLTPDIDWTSAGSDIPLAEFRKQGCNVIRVNIDWADLEPEPMQVSVDTILAIRKFLDRAAAAGIQVILQNTAPFPDSGQCRDSARAPKWAFRAPLPVSDHEQPSKCMDERPSDIFFNDFIFASWTPDDISLQDHLIRDWVKLAEVVNRSAGLLGYGITATTPCPATEDTDKCMDAWAGFLDRAVNSIRAVDQSALIFAGTEPLPADDAAQGSDATGFSGVATALVPRGNDEFRLPVSLKADVNAIFELRHYAASSEQDFLLRLLDLESKGFSYLTATTDFAAAGKMVTDGTDVFAELTARPRVEAVSGKAPVWSFDRLSLPESSGDSAVEPGTTDVFTLEFDQAERKPGINAETTVRLPIAMSSGEMTKDGAPIFTIDISDGKAGWLPGRSDTIVWHTEDSVDRHTMKIVPWGGRRLDFTNELTDIPAR